MGAGDGKVQSKIQFPWQPDLLGPNNLKSLSLTQHSINLGSYFSSAVLLLWIKLCSMLALFISSRYKQRSDIWAFSDAPSISSLNMCLPDQYGGWRLRWSMLQICCTGIMYKTGRDVEVGEKFCSAFVSHQICHCAEEWALCRTWLSFLDMDNKMTEIMRWRL